MFSIKFLKFPSLLFFLGGAIAIVLIVISPKWTVDDAFIIFRYAENLAKHGQLTWNINDNPTEGYTGIALVFILAIFYKFGLNILVVSKIVGILSFLLSAFLLYRVLKLLSVKKITAAVIFSIYLISPMMITHSLSGMETTFFCLAVTLNLYLYLLTTSANSKKVLKEVLFLLSVLLLPLVRPEGIVLSFLTLLIYTLSKIKNKEGGLIAFIIRTIFIVILPGLIYFFWRYNYYGYLLPNTFYAKSYGGIYYLDKIKNILGWFASRPLISLIIFISKLVNLGSLKEFVKFFASYLFIPFLLIIFLKNAIKNKEKNNLSIVKKYFFFSLIIFLIILLAVYFRSQLRMNYAYRFFVPFYIIALIFIGYYLNQCEEIFSNAKRYFIIFLISIIFIQFFLFTNFYIKEYSFMRDYKILIDEVHTKIGKLLDKIIENKKEYLAVHLDAGAIPYYSKLPTLDLGRLNNEFLAHQGKTIFEMVNYFYSLRPAVFVSSSWQWEKLDHGKETEAIISHPKFENYIFVKKFRTKAKLYENYFQFLYLRKDIINDEIIENLEKN